MYVRRNIRFGIIMRFAAPYLVFYFIWSTIIVGCYHYALHIGQDISIPFLPLSTIGIAVAFYLGFKNNSSYDRFWEARKIWGGIVNYSRTWGNQVMCFVTAHKTKGTFSDDELHQIRHRLIYRHIAWLNALRHNLRKPSSFSIKHKGRVKDLQDSAPQRENWDNDVSPFLSKSEYDHIINRKNPPTQIVRLQGQELKYLMEEDGLINDFRHMEMMRVLEEFYNLQGKCERIKNTPFPRQYAYFSKIFTWIFILLLPFGLVSEFNAMSHNIIWLTVPFHMLISWIFITMELVGDNSEDPFENFVNDVPMTALCRTIEIDLREMLGETDLPPKTQAVDDVLF